MEAVSSLLLFQIAATLIPQAVSTFNVTAFWARVIAISLPDRSIALPIAYKGVLSPSPEAVQTKQGYKWYTVFSSRIGLSNERTVAIYLAQHTLQEAHQKQQNVQHSWSLSARNDLFGAKMRDLEQKKQQHLALPALRQQNLTQLAAELRQNQLQRFLDKYIIRHTQIAGVGSGRIATLQAYGIETAADITYSAVIGVPGFGPTYTHKLTSWRASVESQFRFNPSQGVDPKDTATIEVGIRTMQAKLEQELLFGLNQLNEISQQLVRHRQMLWQQNDEALKAIAQAEIDLSFLNEKRMRWLK